MKDFNDPAAKAEIIERIGKLAPGARRQWGKMTAHQMVCHLNDSHLIVMGERTTKTRSNVFGRTVMKFGALRVPMKWPAGVKTVPELDQAAGAGTQPSEFEADRVQLLGLIDRFTAKPRDFQFAEHAIFGQMTEWEWMRWAYLHADHHLRQFGL